MKKDGVHMNYIGKTKKWATEIWEKSNQSTKILFSDDTGFIGRTAYNRYEHTIYLCPKSLFKHFLELENTTLTHESFVKHIVAHELAHSIEAPQEKFPMSFNSIVASQNPIVISKYREFVLHTKFKQEAFAWKNSKKFYKPVEKESFYFLVRSCLKAYKSYEDSYFEEALISYQDSLKDLLKEFTF